MNIKPEVASISSHSPEAAVPCSVPFAEALGETATGYIAPSVVAMGDAASDTLGNLSTVVFEDDHNNYYWWAFRSEAV